MPPPGQWDDQPQWKLCRVPGCEYRARYTAVLLCSRHYQRARYRRRQGLSWNELLTPTGIALLTIRHRPQPRPDTTHHPGTIVWTPPAPTTQSCLTCANLTPTVPRYLTCDRMAWPPGITKVGLIAVERTGLPPILHDYARNCPYYALPSRNGSTPPRSK